MSSVAHIYLYIMLLLFFYFFVFFYFFCVFDVYCPLIVFPSIDNCVIYYYRLMYTKTSPTGTRYCILHCWVGNKYTYCWLKKMYDVRLFYPSIYWYISSTCHSWWPCLLHKMGWWLSSKTTCPPTATRSGQSSSKHPIHCISKSDYIRVHTHAVDHVIFHEFCYNI